MFVLIGKGVPDCVINRVVECLRGDEEQTLWQGELSHPTLRRMGIKQGCPLSPFIFDLIMEAVLESVEEDCGIFRLNQDGRITLPIVLAYADDIIIIAEKPEHLELIVKSIKEYLATVGLNINEDKCQLLVRDPTGPTQDHVTILGKSYEVRKTLKYLGIYLTPKLDRPLTTRTRCRNTVKTSRVVMEFLRKHNPSWEIGRLIYDTVLAPAMLYGTQTAVLTKHSRTSLRNYERQIVREMAALCRHDDPSVLRRSVRELLRRRITQRVRVHQLRYWGHIQRRPASHPTKAASRLYATRLRKCRPSHTWWDAILSSMKRYRDMSYDDWVELAQNKEHLHKKIDELYDIAESTDESELSD